MGTRHSTKVSFVEDGTVLVRTLETGRKVGSTVEVCPPPLNKLTTLYLLSSR